MTINELSNSCGVGDTTVFRFCRSMNVGGISGFQTCARAQQQCKRHVGQQGVSSTWRSPKICMNWPSKYPGIYGCGERNLVLIG